MRHINGFVRKFVRLATITRADAIRREHTLLEALSESRVECMTLARGMAGLFCTSW